MTITALGKYDLLAIWDIDQMAIDSTLDWPAQIRLEWAIYFLTGHKLSEFPLNLYQYNINGNESGTQYSHARVLANYAFTEGWIETEMHPMLEETFEWRRSPADSEGELFLEIMKLQDRIYEKLFPYGRRIVMPGVIDSLEHILGENGVNYISSGNSLRSASLKLELADLMIYFQHSFNEKDSSLSRLLLGYHGELGIRSELINLTCRLLSSAGQELINYEDSVHEKTIYFGDRPSDVISAINSGISDELRISAALIQKKTINGVIADIRTGVYDTGVNCVFVNPLDLGEIGEPYRQIIEAYISRGKCLHIKTLEDERVKPYVNKIVQL